MRLHRSTGTAYFRPIASYSLLSMSDSFTWSFGNVPTFGYSFYIVSVTFDRFSTLIQLYTNTAARNIVCFCDAVLQCCMLLQLSCTAAKNTLPRQLRRPRSHSSATNITAHHSPRFHYVSRLYICLTSDLDFSLALLNPVDIHGIHSLHVLVRVCINIV